MWMTQREAARMLAGAGLSRRGATHVLEAGLAGRPLRTTAAVLYEAAAVAALLARPPLRDADLAILCPDGVLLTRRHVDVLGPAVRTTLCEPWRMSPWTRVALQLSASQGRPVPLLATVRGFIVAGFEVVAVHAPAAGTAQLELADPGGWYEDVADHRLVREPQAPWQLRGALGQPWLPPVTHP